MAAVDCGANLAWNPNRDWPTADELAQLAAALGCEVRQVLAHI